MPTQTTLTINQGAISAAIYGSRGDGSQGARRAFAKQGFSTVRNFMKDRERHDPIANTNPKAGETLTFEITNNHDLTTFVDFRFTLPGLNAADIVVDPRYKDPTAAIADPTTTTPLQRKFQFPQQPENFVVNVGVDYSDYGTILHDALYNPSAPTSTSPYPNTFVSGQEPRYKYRIPSNPGAAGNMTSAVFAAGLNYANLDLVDSSDYAVIPGGYPNPGPYNGVVVNPSTDVGKFEDLGTTAKPLSSFNAYEAPNPIWVDYVAYYAAERITLIHGTNKLMEFSGVDMWKLHVKWHNQETTEHYRIMTGGHSNGPSWDVNDVIFASYAREMVLPLDFVFWVGKISEALPIIGAAKPLQIKIKLRDPEYLYLFQKYDTRNSSDPDGTNPLTNNLLTRVDVPLRNVYLEVHKTHVHSTERSMILRDLDSEYGYNWKCMEIEKQEDIRLTAAQNKKSCIIPLVGLKGAVTTLFLTKIHILDKQSKFSTFWTNFLRINDFSVVSGKDSIVPVTDHFYERNRIHILYNNAKLSNYNVYCHNYSLLPNEKFDAWGHLEYGNLHNPQLVLNYANDYYNPLNKTVSIQTVGGSEIRTENVFVIPSEDSTGSPVDHANTDHVVDVMAVVHQFIQFKSGQITAVFN
jgi:hypothetical protein